MFIGNFKHIRRNTFYTFKYRVWKFIFIIFFILFLFLSNGTKPAQKLLFSATLSQDPEKLSRLSLFHPILFTTVVTDKDTDVNLDKLAGDFVGRYTSPGELTELAVKCPLEYKPIILYRLLTRHDIISKTLVFTNSGHTAHRLALLMQLLLSEWKLPVAVGELSAQLTAKQRESILGKFASGDIHVYVFSKIEKKLIAITQRDEMLLLF